MGTEQQTRYEGTQSRHAAHRIARHEQYSSLLLARVRRASLHGKASPDSCFSLFPVITLDALCTPDWAPHWLNGADFVFSLSRTVQLMGTGGGPKELIDCLFTLFFFCYFSYLKFNGKHGSLVIRTLG
jgi:hypothetical protein